MATKQKPDYLEKWRTQRRLGFLYGVHIRSGSNGKITETPGQVYSSRSGRKGYCDKQKLAYAKSGKVLIERFVSAP